MSKILHNKFVLVAFVLIIVLFMFGIGVAFQLQHGSRNQDDIVAELFGEPVSALELELSRFAVQRFWTDTSPAEIDLPELHRRSWHRLALLRKAEQLGISCEDEELSEVFHRDPHFHVNGEFSAERYKLLAWVAMGVSTSTREELAEHVVRGWITDDDATRILLEQQEALPKFEEIMRQQQIIQKLRKTITSDVNVPPTEVNKALKRISDELTVQFAGLDSNKLAVDTRINDEQARAFYEENAELFREPEKRSVRYLSWSVSNSLDIASMFVTTRDIEVFYNDTISTYSSTGANGAITYRPLDEVAADIRNKLVTEQAKALALEFANEALGMTWSEDFSTVADDFGRVVTVADAFDTVVRTSDLFSASGSIEGIKGATEDFIATTFELTPEGLGSMDISVGDGIVYLIKLERIAPSFIPEFEAVADIAEEQAIVQAQIDKARERIEVLLNDGVSFEDAAKTVGSEVQDAPPFLPCQIDDRIANSLQAMLVRHVLDLQPGELTDVLNTPIGTGVGYLKSRQAGPVEEVDRLRPEVQALLERSQADTIFTSWADEVVAAAGRPPEMLRFRNRLRQTGEQAESTVPVKSSELRKML